jgi:hypothetical protein
MQAVSGNVFLFMCHPPFSPCCLLGDQEGQLTCVACTQAAPSAQPAPKGTRGAKKGLPKTCADCRLHRWLQLQRGGVRMHPKDIEAPLAANHTCPHKAEGGLKEEGGLYKQILNNEKHPDHDAAKIFRERLKDSRPLKHATSGSGKQSTLARNFAPTQNRPLPWNSCRLPTS